MGSGVRGSTGVSGNMNPTAANVDSSSRSLKLSEFEAMERGSAATFIGPSNLLKSDEEICTLRQSLVKRYVELQAAKLSPSDLEDRVNPLLSPLLSAYEACVKDVNTLPSNFLTEVLPSIRQQVELSLDKGGMWLGVTKEQIPTRARRLIISFIKRSLLISPKDLTLRYASPATLTPVVPTEANPSSAENGLSLPAEDMSAVHKSRECELQILLLMEIFGWEASGQPKDPVPNATRVKVRQFLGIWLFSIDLDARALLDHTMLALFGKTHPVFIGQLYEDFDQPNPFQASENPPSKEEANFLAAEPKIAHREQKRPKVAKDRVPNLPIASLTHFTCGLRNVKRLFNQIPISKPTPKPAKSPTPSPPPAASPLVATPFAASLPSSIYSAAAAVTLNAFPSNESSTSTATKRKRTSPPTLVTNNTSLPSASLPKTTTATTLLASRSLSFTANTPRLPSNNDSDTINDTPPNAPFPNSTPLAPTLNDSLTALDTPPLLLESPQTQSTEPTAPASPLGSICMVVPESPKISKRRLSFE